MWDLPEIQLTFKRRSEFAFVDNMEYFFNKAELLYLDDYQPIRMDALQTRWKTTGLTDRRYEIKERYFHIYDVGGQRKCGLCLFVSTLSVFERFLKCLEFRVTLLV